ncbi:hypothetical protein MGA3_00055 [Bacillus methanolicus MGA3]|nr:hypothetical protein MGA3_00055 [Bacillus methanolicus MGA3]
MTIVKTVVVDCDGKQKKEEKLFYARNAIIRSGKGHFF